MKLLLLAAVTLHVSLAAPTHTPKVGAHWPYTVTATVGGKAAVGHVTAQIVDPLGGKHPVGFGRKKGNVTNVAFKGTFKDFVIWPAESVGYPLTFRVTVTVGKTKRVVNYVVTVHK
ncbi:MAG TPA: hypothetical protein VGH52_09720 [Gaiellaceae bacterium]